MTRKLLVLATMLLLLSTAQLFAQVNATIGGTVSDSTGAFIPGVEVTATNINTGIVTTRLTNETGSFEIPSLQPGAYKLTATLSGFQNSTYNNLQLNQGQQVRQNFTLTVASAATSVDVVAEADTLLATTTASVGNVLPERDVQDLPVATRNVLDLVATTPGAVGSNFAGASTSQVNTTRDGLTTNDGRYNNGVYSAIFTSPDMVEAVKVSVTSIDPALGRGNAQVQMQTRAGSNGYHGALFYTNFNSALNAMSWFDNLTGSTKSYNNRNQYGGRFGGPIKKNKAFFFVLVDDQRYVERQLVSTTVLTEQARQGIFRYLTAGSVGGTSRRNGNAFSTTPSVDLNGKILTSDGTNPLFLNSFNVFSDVKDPNRTKIDSAWISSQYLPRMPLPNDYTLGDGLNTAGFKWFRTHNGVDGATGQDPRTDRNHLTTRFDYQINDRNKVTYTMTKETDWGVTGQTGLPDFPGGYFGDVRRVPDFYTASWSSTLSASMLNEFRFGLKRDYWEGTSGFDKGCCYGGHGENELADTAKAARASMPQVDGYMVVTAPGLSLGRYSTFGVASPRNSVSPFRQFADTLSFNIGTHAFQAGVDFDFANTRQSNHGGQATTRPLASLGVAASVPVPNITATNFKGLASNDITTAQNLLANLAGSISSISQQYFVNSPTATEWADYKTSFLFKRDLHENDWAMFFKDNWKMTRNFTLNLGVRYDKYGTPYDTTGLGGRFTGGQKSLFGCSGSDFSVMWSPFVGCDLSKLTTTELVGKGSLHPELTVWKNDWNNIAPSIGFSYSIPWLKNNTVVRGGYGINYAGADALGGYSGSIGNLPGQTLVTNAPIATYLDVAGLQAAHIVPVTTNGSDKPFSPVSLTNRSAGITGYADKRVTPYIQSFNLSVQREIMKGTTLNVSWVGNKSTKLTGSTQLNESNIFENGILDAFNTTRNGGNAALFDKIFLGLNVPGAGVVNGTTLTGSQALRIYTSTNTFLANGDVGGLANFLNTSTAITGVAGGFLRRVGLPENFIVVNPQFGSISLAGNTSNSTYHSLEAQVTKRLSHGVSGQGSYTFSKTLGSTGTRNPRDVNFSKGILSFDRTHILKANGTWELPFGKNRMFLGTAPAWAQRIVEGWQFSSIYSYVSGTPLTFTSSRGTVGSRASNTADLVGSLPDGLGKVETGAGFVQYFSGLTAKPAPKPSFGGDTSLPGVFTNQVVVNSAGQIVLQNPTPGITGNTAQNLPSVRGPGTLGLDLAFSKLIRIGESRSITIRADAINALNRPQWGNPVTDINAANFGRITSASGSRTITLNGRLDF